MRIARGASWASCELRDASCASMSAVVPHGAKERSAGGMRPLARYLGPRWFSLPQSSRSCRARGAPFSLVGVWRSCRRSSFLHSASPARACCDAPLSRHASGACGSLLSASGERRGVSLACVLRAARDLLSSIFGSLRRLFIVSRSCRARVASSSLSLLALRGFVVASTLSATRLRTPAIRTQRDAGRGVVYLRVDSRRPFPISCARALPLCVSVCAWPHRPLATGQRPCCLLWLA